MSSYNIIMEDVMTALPRLEANSFDGLLCDPPYHLTQASRGGSPRKPGTGPFGRHHLGESGFMGQTWDGGDVAFKPEVWKEALRVLKPGAYLLAFGGDRTFHRLTCAIEDAGFRIVGHISWLYSQGMPKSLDISKAFDRSSGAEREVVGQYKPPEMKSQWNLKNAKDERTVDVFASPRSNLDITAPATEDARLWDGYGTALKPSWEPIVVAMKPLDGTYIENAKKWGVAGFNLKECRTEAPNESIVINEWSDGAKPFGGGAGHNYTTKTSSGRWPSNVILSCDCEDKNHHPECPVALLDAQSGNSASRFFYCAKASTRERKEGTDGKNIHPTVKPVSLTEHLAKLIIPPKSGNARRILVPFSGSGSEMLGAMMSGWEEVVGIENGGGDTDKAKEYCSIANSRISSWEKQKGGLFE